MAGTSAECKYFSHRCELDVGCHLCVLYAVSVLLLFDWKQEEGVGRSDCSTNINWLCEVYFFDGNHIVDSLNVGFTPRLSIVYDAVYFIVGGLIFLYRKEMAEFASKRKAVACTIWLISIVAYFAVGGSTLTMLFFCVAALVYTFGCNRGVTGQSSLPSSLEVFASRFTWATW